MRRTVLLVAAAMLFGASLSSAGLNLADPGLPDVTSAYGGTHAGNSASSMCVDCHTENPKPNSGTHFVVHYDGSSPRSTNNTGIEVLVPWSSGASSLYGVVTPPNSGASYSPADTAGEMICESCHNIMRNVDGGDNLVDTPVALCQGCHTGPVAGRLTSHHPMTGDGVGACADLEGPHTLNTGHTSHLRNPPIAGSGASYPGSNMVDCFSCHTPHGAALGAAARILQRGVSTSAIPGVTGGAVNVIYAAGNPQTGDAVGDVKVWDTGNAVPGIDRQSDITTEFAPAVFRLVSNIDPLCEACHSAP